MNTNDPIIVRRRQLCQNMGKMAWPDEVRAARDEISGVHPEVRDLASEPSHLKSIHVAYGIVA